MFEKLREKNVQRHLVPCPHCQKDVLDHMTACPFCKGELEPQVARGADPETIRKTRRALSIIGFAIAAVLLILRFLR